MSVYREQVRMNLDAAKIEGAVSDEQIFRDFLLIVANIDPLRWNYDEMRALVADARNRLDVAKGGRLSNEATA